MHRPRKEMIAETRAKLIAAARHAFGTTGYAEASMDDFTASAGLTRGALYHHFGDKKGLLQAVIAQIDGEMAARINEVASRAPTRWQHFVDECSTYIEMALEPEIQRIMFRDGPAVLGDPAQWPNCSACIASMTDHLTALQEEGVVVSSLDPETASRLINGASSQAAQRIANSSDPEATSKKVVTAFKQLLEGLLKKPDPHSN
ncbi:MULTISPECIES: TetR/AcrR family transcriptional regulator [unclassified Mesorhizobium]|uniref:TetR/AcrR family transcriptional regulator n=1 Tax=unclassified Mesorhizobium TaxID=325217 RepID=UPI000FCA8976|nr:MULTISPECIES: TetR/AcrR family transcriptional regulator [unclassified Mesorhizobium]RUU52450.1 TetR/AcrR family transcriptional regulator [Mesorhizobium sp. M7A.T.Ca.TU.009.01.1.1]RUU86971.1 TetR/AcrR family transcriptional regulator [Mesorhizobium sp. M7A.T.Ca.TU.009.01.1.2]RUT84641.1 TetR/AcrR family transcriptional regulator [Mesorhizobium sp. M7A.T.Ca.US.000.02.1.1]RUT87578.1 TetR/AcrR family transcriptional regulator [Mesorhizobium sp. M7A.T.Ca.US.000.02.2.1]RUT97888.1 TetR/AcrR famil